MVFTADLPLNLICTSCVHQGAGTSISSVLLLWHPYCEILNLMLKEQLVGAPSDNIAMSVQTYSSIVGS